MMQGEPPHSAALSGSSIHSDTMAQKPLTTGSAQSVKAETELDRQAHLAKQAEDVNVRSLERYYQTDMVHLSSLFSQIDVRNSLLRSKEEELRYHQQLRQQTQNDPGAIFGHGFAGYGNGSTNGPTVLVYPSDKKRLGNRKGKELVISSTEREAQADLFEELIPIRLDVELEKVKLRDTFTWNLHDRTVPVDLFVETLVEDFKVPEDSVAMLTQQVSREIHEQIQDYYPHLYLSEDTTDASQPSTTALPSKLPVPGATVMVPAAAAAPSGSFFSHRNDEIRILIKLNITVDQLTLIDQFEWDINNPLNNPEEFARILTRDMALSGEFTTAIAHSIREQTQLFTKSLYIVGHPFDGRPVDDFDICDSVLPSPIPNLFRASQPAKDHAPYLYELNEQDIQREEMAVLREQRRQKRQVNRRGGPALPDLKERPRTARTLIVSSIIPGSAESVDTSRLLKVTIRQQTSRSKRAARGDPRNVVDDSEMSDSDDDAGGAGGGGAGGVGGYSPLPDTGFTSHGAAGGTSTPGGGGSTARTRTRVAASAAQAAMKASFRTGSPDVSGYAPDVRTPAGGVSAFSRRLLIDRDDSPDGSPDRNNHNHHHAHQSLVVVLKFRPIALQQFWNNRRAGGRYNAG